jgi:serine/threonine protein kinase
MAPEQMAPEQARGSTGDVRSDIYSLGILLYEMVTGKPPFESTSVDQLLVAKLSGSNDFPSPRADLPPELNALILKCLEVDPADRFQTMAELGNALSEAIPDLGVADLAQLVLTAVERVRDSEIENQISTQEVTPSRIRQDEVRHANGVLPVIEIRAARDPQHNGERLSASTRSQAEGDAVQKRDITLVESLPDDNYRGGDAKREGLPQPRGTYLRTIDSPNTISECFALSRDKMTIGRGVSNDIVLNTPKASRFHAAVMSKKGHSYIEDFNSANGTLLNGTRISQRCELHDEDQIQIGDYILEFRRENPAEEAP